MFIARNNGTQPSIAFHTRFIAEKYCLWMNMRTGLVYYWVEEDVEELFNW